MTKNIITFNTIIIILSIIFISVIVYFTFVQQSVLLIVDQNGTILTTEQVEQTFYVGLGAARVLTYFTASTTKLLDAKEYGIYVIPADKKQSSSKSTCLRYNFNLKTPCNYYKCPSKYLGYDLYKMGSNNKCGYIKYPLATN